MAETVITPKNYARELSQRPSLYVAPYGTKNRRQLCAVMPFELVIDTGVTTLAFDITPKDAKQLELVLDIVDPAMKAMLQRVDAELEPQARQHGLNYNSIVRTHKREGYPPNIKLKVMLPFDKMVDANEAPMDNGINSLVRGDKVRCMFQLPSLAVVNKTQVYPCLLARRVMLVKKYTPMDASVLAFVDDDEFKRSSCTDSMVN
eukprot:jgi/Chrzof1/14278/Cz08g31300.t1